MLKIGGSKGVAVQALAMSIVILACDGDPQDKPVVVAQATATDVSEPVVTATKADSPKVEITKPANVSFENAEAVFRKGRYREAAEMFGSHVITHPNNGFGHYMLGLSAWKSGDRGKAVEALTRAVELDSLNVKARTNLGRVLLEQGEADAALPHLQRALELTPDSHEVWRVLGNVHAELGNTDSAMTSYRSALVRNPKDAWSMNNYGLVLIRLGRYEEALEPLARAVELMSRSPVFHNNLGVAFESSGWLSGAITAYAAAIEADSTYVKAKISLERVRKQADDEVSETPDIKDLARRFAERIESWREAGSSGVATW